MSIDTLPMAVAIAHQSDQELEESDKLYDQRAGSVTQRIWRHIMYHHENEHEL